MRFVEDPSPALVDAALEDLAQRVGALVVTNTLLQAENRLLLQAINGASSPTDGGTDDDGAEPRP